MRGGSGFVRAWLERLQPSADLSDAVFLAKFPRDRPAEGLKVRERECPDRFLQRVPETEAARQYETRAETDVPVELQRRRHNERKHRQSRHHAVLKGDSEGVWTVGNPVDEIANHAEHSGARRMPAERGSGHYFTPFCLPCHCQADPGREVNEREIASIKQAEVIQQKKAMTGIAPREGRSNK